MIFDIFSLCSILCHRVVLAINKVHISSGSDNHRQIRYEKYHESGHRDAAAAGKLDPAWLVERLPSKNHKDILN